MSWIRSQSTRFICTERTNTCNKHWTTPPTYPHRNAYNSLLGASYTTQTSVRMAVLTSCQDLPTEYQKMKEESSIGDRVMSLLLCLYLHFHSKILLKCCSR